MPPAAWATRPQSTIDCPGFRRPLDLGYWQSSISVSGGPMEGCWHWSHRDDCAVRQRPQGSSLSKRQM